MADIEVFKANIENSGIVLDAPDEHHIFKSGMHGRKLDFDNIGKEHPLYGEWVDVNVQTIRYRYSRLPDVILGVANGTNRLAPDVAEELEGPIGLESRKNPDKSTRLSKPLQVFRLIRPKFVVVLEDVGTTGSTSVTTAQAALEAGAQEVEVLVTWQRREQLEKLSEGRIPYDAIIYDPLPTFDVEDCAVDGYCAEGARLIDTDGTVLRLKQT